MNREKYDELSERVGDQEIDRWYIKSQEVFRKQSVQTEDDFIKLVAFAYSWMPTIPEWRGELDWNTCSKALEDLKKGNLTVRKELLRLTVPCINNSIVGASKVLHFACPDRVPIIDSNVVIGWRALFFPLGVRRQSSNEMAALPVDFGAYGSNEEKRNRHIDLYVKYWDNLLSWCGVLGDVSIRDIETKIYILGKQISEEVKQANQVS